MGTDGRGLIGLRVKLLINYHSKSMSCQDEFNFLKCSSLSILSLMEDDLLRKVSLYGGLLLMEDEIQWKSLCIGRQHLMEYDLRRKTTFEGR